MRDSSVKRAAKKRDVQAGPYGPLASVDALLHWALVKGLVRIRRAPPGSDDARWAAGVLGAVLTVLSDLTFEEAARHARGTLNLVSLRIADHEAFAGIRTLPLSAIAAVMNARAAGWGGRQDEPCAPI